MSGPTCPKCDHIGHPTCAVTRFSPGGPAGYIAGYLYDAAEAVPVRNCRAEAEADQCAWQAARAER